MHKKHFVLGGDLKKSLTDGYQLNFKSLFKDAITITRKHFFPLVTASLFTIILLAGCYHFTFGGLGNLTGNEQMLGNYLIALLVAPPLLTGLQMMGIHHSIGLKTKSIDLFNYFRMIIKLSMATLIISAINNAISLLLTQTLGQIGFVVSIVVLLYLNMAFTFVYPLISEKKVKPQAALILSFKLVHKNILQFTLLFIMLGILFFVAIIPSGLGLFIFIPFYFNLMGIIYRSLCGVGVVATSVDNDTNNSSDESTSTNSSSDHFDA